MIKTLLFSVLIIAICIAFLGIKVILKPKGEMTSMHIHDSQAMKDRGIHCVIDQDREERNRAEMVHEKLHNKNVESI